MKKDYKAPEMGMVEFEVERGFENSGEWYENGGSGDFTYTTETEDTWS